MGVWIETRMAFTNFDAEKLSHPSWVCGLKLNTSVSLLKDSSVTPFVGVWIETNSSDAFLRLYTSHPSWVCGLKL